MASFLALQVMPFCNAILPWCQKGIEFNKSPNKSETLELKDAGLVRNLNMNEFFPLALKEIPSLELMIF